MVYTLIEHRNGVIKCSKIGIETTRQRLVVPFYDVVSMVYKTVHKEKLWSIC